MPLPRSILQRKQLQRSLGRRSNLWACEARGWHALGAGNVPESGWKTQRSGAEEHRAIVSLSPWGIWVSHYAVSLCQGGLESQNSKRSLEETGLKHFISEIFMPERKNKKEAGRCFSALKWRNGAGRGIFLRQELVLTSVAEGSWLSLTAASSCPSSSPAVKQPQKSACAHEGH